MILLGIFKFIGFLSGIILTLIVVGLFLRGRSPRGEGGDGEHLRSENFELRSRAAQLESELQRQQQELQQIRRELRELQRGESRQ